MDFQIKLEVELMQENAFDYVLDVQGVSKRALQRYFKCHCVPSVTKTFTLEGVQTLQRSTP
jgi:hypothetical protein